MSYIDAFAVAVPTENKALYIEHAKRAGDIFKESGATKILEAWGDDVPDGEVTSFHLAVKAKEHETVVFSIAFWPSKEVRDYWLGEIDSYLAKPIPEMVVIGYLIASILPVDETKALLN